MAVKRKDLRTRLFDWIIIFSSWISIITGIAAIFITGFLFHVYNFRPYMLYSLIIIMGFIGFRNWFRENID